MANLNEIGSSAGDQGFITEEERSKEVILKAQRDLAERKIKLSEKRRDFENQEGERGLKNYFLSAYRNAIYAREEKQEKEFGEAARRLMYILGDERKRDEEEFDADARVFFTHKQGGCGYLGLGRASRGERVFMKNRITIPKSQIRKEYEDKNLFLVEQVDENTVMVTSKIGHVWLHFATPREREDNDRSYYEKFIEIFGSDWQVPRKLDTQYVSVVF